MSRQAVARFGIEAWDEQPWHEGPDGRKLTRATVTKMYTGDISGKGTMQYVMSYLDETSATFVGLERIEGNLAGRAGSFVMKDVGRFEAGVARSSFEILAGLGRDGLAGIRGSARVDAVHADEQTMTLDYELD